MCNIILMILAILYLKGTDWFITQEKDKKTKLSFVLFSGFKKLFI